jgi:hypothetical protein
MFFLVLVTISPKKFNALVTEIDEVSWVRAILIPLECTSLQNHST